MKEVDRKARAFIYAHNALTELSDMLSEMLVPKSEAEIDARRLRNAWLELGRAVEEAEA